MSLQRLARWMNEHDVELRRDSTGQLQALEVYTIDCQVYGVWVDVEPSFGWCVEFLGY